MAGLWDPSDQFSPASLGVSGAVPASAAQSTNPGIARSAITAVESPLSGDNPLWVAGALIAVTAGLIAFSTAGRVGPFRASASVGKNP